MAEESHGGGPVQDVLFVLGGLAVLVVVWFLSGGPERADLRGIFLAPPAPLGSGEAYGPQIGEEASTTSPYVEQSGFYENQN